MSGKVLVAFATRSGATQEIAAAVADALSAEGLEVDLQPAKSVRALAGYSGVVLGAPLYMFHWHPDALNFLKKHRAALERVPVAIFAGGPWNDKEEEWQGVRNQITGELAKFPWLKPAAVEVVGGRFDPARLTFPYSWIPAMKSMVPSDIRDWNKIHDWAAGLAEIFQPVSQD